jgi:hypothetical protein
MSGIKLFLYFIYLIYKEMFIFMVTKTSLYLAIEVTYQLARLSQDRCRRFVGMRQRLILGTRAAVKAVWVPVGWQW